MEIYSNYSNIISHHDNSSSGPSDDLINKAKEGLIHLLEPIFGSIDPDQIQIKESQFMIWPDTAMGCPQLGHMYAQVEISAYQIQFSYQDKTYRIHIDLEGSHIVSPDFVQRPVRHSSESEQAPSIFDLCTKMTKSSSSNKKS